MYQCAARLSESRGTVISITANLSIACMSEFYFTVVCLRYVCCLGYMMVSH